MRDYLQHFPAAVRLDIAGLAAAIIERASSLGDGRWGATPYANGIRLNVGWTEIFTALPDHIRLIADGGIAGKANVPKSVSMIEGINPRGYYPSVAGSILCEIPYRPMSEFRRAISTLMPAAMKSVDGAGRRGAGRGVKGGHRQQVVAQLAEIIGRALPQPKYADEAKPTIEEGAALMEGALRRVVSSEYERNAAARDACIEHHGPSCAACGFSFEAVYGSLGAGFIHVHHLVPISSRNTEYQVNPVKDLVPVCPNCHAMIHRADPPLTVQAIRDLIARPVVS